MAIHGEINDEADIKGTFVAPSFPWLGFHLCIFMQIMMDGPRKDERHLDGVLECFMLDLKLES